METTIIQNKNKTAIWAKYYENQKKFWFNPDIHWGVKLLVRYVELHRSDSKGWNLSVRKAHEDLGMSSNFIMKYLNQALDLGYLQAKIRTPRKRRKLRLSVSLRAPVEFGISSENLSHWERQPVSQGDTDSVSRDETTNSNRISKAFNNKPEETHLKKEIRETLSYKDEENLGGWNSGMELIRRKRKELGL